MATKQLSILCLSLLFGGSHGEFFRAQGTEIVDPNGEKFFTKGLVLSGWLNVEAYVLRLNDVHDRHLNGQADIEKNVERLLGNTWDADFFWKTFRENFVTAADVAGFAEHGFNALRIPFNYRLISPVSGVYNEEGFDMMDRVISWCKDQNLGVILDMHATPGGQAPIQYADPEYTYWYENEATGVFTERGVGVLWEDNAEYRKLTGKTPEFHKNRTAEIWREVARRYQNETSIMAYEIMNQPFFYESSGVSDQDLRAFFIQVTTAIREVDTNHIVIVEGNNYAEDIGGLLPPWDDNMVIAFHRYWRPTDLADGMIQTYLDAREEHQVPLLMSESGENSNTWLFELARLLEEHNIGYFFWGFKKVESISAANEVFITPDYQYVIDNWRDVPDSKIDSARIRRGLMEMAEGMKTTHCRALPGFFAALFDPKYGSTSQPYSDEIAVPGKIHSVHYDIGIQGISYSDVRFKNDETELGEPYNNGWIYRNDGVDIRKNIDDADDVLSIGYHVTDTEAGEWLKYTVNVTQSANYHMLLHTYSMDGNVGKIQLSSDGVDLVGDVGIPDGGGWLTYIAGSAFELSAGKHVLELYVVEGGFDVAWMEFMEASSVPPSIVRAVDLRPSSANGVAISVAVVSGLMLSLFML